MTGSDRNIDFGLGCALALMAGMAGLAAVLLAFTVWMLTW